MAKRRNAFINYQQKAECCCVDAGSPEGLAGRKGSAFLAKTESSCSLDVPLSGLLVLFLSHPFQVVSGILFNLMAMIFFFVENNILLILKKERFRN